DDGPFVVDDLVLAAVIDHQRQSGRGEFGQQLWITRLDGPVALAVDEAPQVILYDRGIAVVKITGKIELRLDDEMAVRVQKAPGVQAHVAGGSDIVDVCTGLGQEYRGTAIGKVANAPVADVVAMQGDGTAGIGVAAVISVGGQRQRGPGRHQQQCRGDQKRYGYRLHSAC